MKVIQLLGKTTFIDVQKCRRRDVTLSRRSVLRRPVNLPGRHDPVTSELPTLAVNSDEHQVACDRMEPGRFGSPELSCSPRWPLDDFIVCHQN